MMFVKITFAVCVLVGIVVWGKADSCVISKLCLVDFFIVYKSSSVVLQSIVMTYAEYGDMGRWSDDRAC